MWLCFCRIRMQIPISRMCDVERHYIGLHVSAMRRLSRVYYHTMHCRSRRDDSSYISAFMKDVGWELFTDLVNKGTKINYGLPTTGYTALDIAIRCESKNTALAIFASGDRILIMDREGVPCVRLTAQHRPRVRTKWNKRQDFVMISYTHMHIEFARLWRTNTSQPG